MAGIKTASVYDGLKEVQGTKVLVTRLWPRGIRKQAVAQWLKELGPSYELLRRYKDGAASWGQFRKEYLAGLKDPSVQESLKALQILAAKESIVLLCVCTDEKHCHRSLLRRKLER